MLVAGGLRRPCASEHRAEPKARVAVVGYPTGIAWLLWYNQTRLHSTLPYVSPIRFEQD